jgi:multidrug resistance efflux pump
VIYQKRELDIKQKIISSQQELNMVDAQLGTNAERYVLIKNQVQRLNALKQDGHVSNAEFDSVLQQELTASFRRAV